MSVLNIGRVCVKTTGRTAGRKVVIVGVESNNSVLIDGPKIKRKKCNVKHLQPLNEVLKVTEKTTSDEITKLLK